MISTNDCKRRSGWKKKDYYKILNLGRDAGAKTIKRAYRKAAMNAHPDKGNEAKMASVNGAYEVLSKSEESHIC